MQEKESDLELLGVEPWRVDKNARVVQLEADVEDLGKVNQNLLNLFVDSIARSAAKEFHVSNLRPEVEMLKEKGDVLHSYERDRKRAQVSIFSSY